MRWRRPVGVGTESEHGETDGIVSIRISKLVSNFFIRQNDVD